MKFTFQLYVQKHRNHTYTAIPVPFWDISAFGPNLDELKTELAEAVRNRIERMPPAAVGALQPDATLTLHTVTVNLRPVDRKKRKKRRERVEITFSLLVQPEEDRQLLVTVPRLGQPPLSFYAYNRAELDDTARTEITAWLDDEPLEALSTLHHAPQEFLDTLEVEAEVRKATEEARPYLPSLGGDDDDDGDDFWALREVGIDLTAQVAEERFRRAYQRDEVVGAILQILLGTRHNSVLVTGPAESGKTAIIHEVVRRIHAGECDEALHGRRVWLITPDRIIAGAQFVGTWEERINDIVDECRKRGHILYVPDLPGLLEVGRWSKSDANVGMALKPHIASGEVTVIGEAAPQRLAMGETIGPSFINLFRRLDIGGMSEEETLSLLGNVARDLERDLNVRILPDAIQASVGLSRRFWPYRAFPGKAIRLLEETATDVTRRHTRSATAGSSRLLQRLGRQRVARQHVIGTFARFSGLPEFIVNDAAQMSLPEVEAYFYARIIGQDEAVSAMVDLVAMVKAGLNDPQKPLGTFLFIGPTGVGKTQMAKTLAAYLFGDENRLIRFDMSEYSDVDGVARLIGAFDREGELTRRVREQPFSVILLDEFEKASWRIYDIFLQVLGEGRLTDAAGKTAFFHNAILIMTSNLGGGARAFRPPGFQAGDPVDPKQLNAGLRAHYIGQIERHFRPEFVNRIDKIVVFGQLSQEAVRGIARREVNEILLRDGITRRNMLVEIDEDVIDLVVARGYSPEYGARLLKRAIEDRVVAPMARALAQRGTGEHNLLRVTVEDGALTLKNVPIADAGKTTVTLAEGLERGTSRVQRMNLSELAEGFGLLRGKLADWTESETLREMMAEKERLLAATHADDFWDDSGEARTAMRRFYFLDRLTRRLRQLQERAEYLEDFSVLVSRERDVRYQSELARDYERLYHDVSFLDIELRTAHLPHRNQAMMLIAPLGTQPQPPEQPAQTWPRRLAEVYLWWAERKGYDRDIYLLTPDPAAPGGRAFTHLTAGSFKALMERFRECGRTDEIALWFEGSNVFGFLKGERGLHRLLRGDLPGEEEIARVQVFALPDDTNVTDWLGEYQRIKAEIASGQRPQPPQERHAVIRLYSLDRGEKFVRDQRTGVRLTNIKGIMQKGQIDPLILAYLREQEDGPPHWEDRNPPTFPF